mgnify:CR=1 FL=1
MTIASPLPTAALVAGLAAPLGSNLLPAQERLSPPSASNSGRPAIQAPVGHRQPRAADIPRTEKTEAELREERQQAELSRRLRICRGC